MLPAAMFALLFLLIFIGTPVSFALISVAIVAGYFEFGSLIGIQAFRFIYDVSSNYILASIPLFVLMGCVLERSGLAEKLYAALRLWVGRAPGGLAVATIAMCAVFAAGSGIVGAVEALVGMMAIRPMIASGYNKGLVSGTICAGGSLGTMIPPSVVVVIYGSIANVSIGKLFAGVLIPGLIMIALFILYIVVRCVIRPEDGPVARDELAAPLAQKLWVTATALVPILALVFAVIGSIIAGVASPTEAAGVGAVGAILLSMIYRTFNPSMLREALVKALLINAMIMLIVIGGTLFTSIFRVSGGDSLVSGVVEGLDLGAFGAVVLFMGIIFLLGFVLDWTSILLISIPIFLPHLIALQVDPLWFGILSICAIQTSYLTPPFAPSIFYLRAIAKNEFTYSQMYSGIAPFVVIQLLVLILVFLFPVLATWLPSLM